MEAGFEEIEFQYRFRFINIRLDLYSDLPFRYRGWMNGWVDGWMDQISIERKGIRCHVRC